jgi:hypothetical protein
MSLTSRVALTGLTFLTVHSIALAAHAPKARGIITRAVKATGGLELLQKRTRIDVEDKGTYYGMGEGVPYYGSVRVRVAGSVSNGNR